MFKSLLEFVYISVGVGNLGFSLVSLFNSISTFEGYLIPKSSYKTDAYNRRPAGRNQAHQTVGVALSNRFLFFSFFFYLRANFRFFFFAALRQI